MGKKNSNKPQYATTTTDSGNWGSSTTGSSGTTYTAPNWINNTMNTVGNNINPTLNNMLSNDYANDPNFKAYQNQLNRTATQNYDTSVLSQLADRGLMRSSGLQAATNAFADTLANQTTNLYDNYYNRQQNNLSNLINTSNALYNYMAGITGKSQADTANVNNFNLSNTNSNSGLFGQLAQAAGNIAGSSIGSFLGAKGGSK